MGADRRLRWAARRSCAGLLMAAGTIGLPPAVQAQVPIAAERAEITFRLREAQPDVLQAGRVNAIAISFGGTEVLAGTESGGVFRSTDQGHHWTHVDGFAPFGVLDLTFVNFELDVVLATSGRSFDPARSGGIWRSTDRGLTWSRPPTAAPPTASGCPADAAAYRLSVVPGTRRVYAATECGVAVSDDNGLSWIHRSIGVPLPGQPTVVAVQALDFNRAVAAGRAGVYYTRDGGRSWTRSRTRPDPIVSYRALARSPVFSQHVYLVDERRTLHVAEDGGDFFRRLSGPEPGDEGCGGVESVTVVESLSDTDTVRDLDLYVSNRCHFYRSTATRTASDPLPRYSSSWSLLGDDHADTRVMAFHLGSPRFMGSDGGFHVSEDFGASWRLRGGSRGGLGALQIYEVTGQRIDEPRRSDLYIGTQDNNIWSSQDTVHWPFMRPAEGFSIFLDSARESREADTRVTYKRGAPFDTYVARAQYSGERDWTDAQPGYSDPVPVGRGVWVQQTGPVPDDAARPFALSLTDSLGSSWATRVADFGVETTQLPKVSRLGSFGTTAYQAWRAGVDGGGNIVFKLARLNGVAVLGGPDPRFPDHTGFGSLGVTPLQFVWMPIWQVDPQDPMHLLAPDVGDGSMKRTRDGGMTWTRMTDLTRLVTADGARPFVLDLGDLPFPMVTAISFCPQDPNLVIVGTWDSGLFLSVNRGNSWRPVPDSARVGLATRFHWPNPGEVYVSSWGRGLWKLGLSIRYERIHFSELCGSCTAYDLGGTPLPQPVFERALVVHVGGFSDASADQGSLLSLAVTPGSLPVLFSDLKGDALPEIPERAQPGAFAGLPAAQKIVQRGEVVRGFLFSGATVIGVLGSIQETTIAEPGPFNEFKDLGEPEPPLKGRPYIQIATGTAAAGIPMLSDNGVVRVSARGFVVDPRHKVEILLDGQPVARVSVRQDGTFSLRLPVRKLARQVRLAPGVHVIGAVQQVGQRRLVDAAPFSIPNSDHAQPGDEDGDQDEDGKETARNAEGGQR